MAKKNNAPAKEALRPGTETGIIEEKVDLLQQEVRVWRDLR